MRKFEIEIKSFLAESYVRGDFWGLVRLSYFFS